MNQQVVEAPTTTAVSSQPSKPGREIAAQLQKMRPQFAAALPAHIKPDKFERVVLTAISINPDLLDCDRMSLFTSCNKAANDGLLPDGREGALVPFRDKKTGKRIVTWLPMVFGLIKKMRQSGELSTITAQVVHENDTFSYVLGDDERIEHKPLLIGERGKPILAYAIAKLKDGGVQREVMTLADVEKARKISRMPDSLMWKDFWGEGARKTVIKRLAKYLPLSSEDRRVLDRDETEFEAQKRDALLQQAALQIGAKPQAAITHTPASEDVEIIDAPQGDAIDQAEEDTTVLDNDPARAAAEDLCARLIDELLRQPDVDGYCAEVAADIASLPEDLRGHFATAKIERQKALEKAAKGRKL